MGFFFKAWRCARGASLMAAVLLCVGAFLCLLPTELGISAALTPADSTPLDQGADEGYLAVPQEEAQEAEKEPVNADLLTALLLLALSFGATGVELLINGRRQGSFRSLGIDRCRWLLSALEARPFLGVFRL